MTVYLIRHKVDGSIYEPAWRTKKKAVEVKKVLPEAKALYIQSIIVANPDKPK